MMNLTPETRRWHQNSLVPPLAAQFDALPVAWHDCISPFLHSSRYASLCRFIDGECARGKIIYPCEVFHALTLTSPTDTKVVIIGQDPYHGVNQGLPQAHGLAFSVPKGVQPPPSLRNIFKEITAELGYPMPSHGCLDYWARQGVLLLNTVLTVEHARAGSHAQHGWEQCTDILIERLSRQQDRLVFLLWGAHAQAKRILLHQREHAVFEAPHPSPLSAHRGFLGCRHFMLANEYLAKNHRSIIDWRLPDTSSLETV